jgi:hypothetical protein
VIPLRANRTADIRYDKKLYRLRNLIERLVNRLKQYRRIATRYEKTAGCYLSAVLLGVIPIGINLSKCSKISRHRAKHLASNDTLHTHRFLYFS